MTLEKKSTTDDADKGPEKVLKKSSGEDDAKSAEKGKSSKKGFAASEETGTKDKATKGSKKSPSSKKKHPGRFGNPVRTTKILEEESRAAADRVSCTSKKIRDTTSPR